MQLNQGLSIEINASWFLFPAVSKKTDTKWNSSTFCGTFPQFVEQRPKKWNRCWKRITRHSSKNCGTAPQLCGAAPPKSGTGTINSDENHKWHATSKYETVCHFNCKSHRIWSSYKLLFRIIVLFCSTICGTETCLLDLFHFLGSRSKFLGRCSTNCGTVP